MIKLRYDACIFSILFGLNTYGALGEFSKEEERPPVYRIIRVEIDALPPSFHSGTLSFVTRLPLTSNPLIQEYPDPPFLSVVGRGKECSFYRGRPEDKLSLTVHEATYILRSSYKGQDAEGSISDPFESLFQCPANVPLCLRVKFSFSPPLLALEFKEILTS